MRKIISITAVFVLVLTILLQCIAVFADTETPYFKDWGDFSSVEEGYFSNGGATGVTIDKNSLGSKNWLRIFGGANTTMKIPQSFSEDKVLSDSFDWQLTFRAGPYSWYNATFFMLDKDGTAKNCYYLKIANGSGQYTDMQNGKKNIQLYRRKDGESDVLLGETYCGGITDSVPYIIRMTADTNLIKVTITKESDASDTYTIYGERYPEDKFSGGLYFGRYNGTTRITDMTVREDAVVVDDREEDDGSGLYEKNWGDFSSVRDGYFTTGGVSNVIIDKNTLDGKKWLRIYNGPNTVMKIPQSFSEKKVLSDSFEWIFTFRAGPYDWFSTTFYMLDKDGKGENCYYLQITNGASKANDIEKERKNIRLYRRKAGEEDILLGKTYCEGITDSVPFIIKLTADTENINATLTKASNTDDTYKITAKRDIEDNFSGGLYFAKFNGTVRLSDMTVSEKITPELEEEEEEDEDTIPYEKDWEDFNRVKDGYFTNGGVSSVIVDKNTADGKNWLRIYGGANAETRIPQSFSENEILADSFDWEFTFRAGPYDWHNCAFYMLDKKGTGQNCYILKIANGASKDSDIANNKTNIRLYRHKAGETDQLLGEVYCAGLTDSVPYRFKIWADKDNINVKITKSSDKEDKYLISAKRNPEDNFKGGLYFGRYNGTVRLTEMTVKEEVYIPYEKNWEDFSKAENEKYFTVGDSQNLKLSFIKENGQKWMKLENDSDILEGLKESFTEDSQLKSSAEWSFIIKATAKEGSLCEFVLFGDSALPNKECFVLKINQDKVGIYKRTFSDTAEITDTLIYQEVVCDGLSSGTPYEFEIAIDSSGLKADMTKLDDKLSETSTVKTILSRISNSSVGGLYVACKNASVMLTNMEINELATLPNFDEMGWTKRVWKVLHNDSAYLLSTAPTFDVVDSFNSFGGYIGDEDDFSDEDFFEVDDSFEYDDSLEDDSFDDFDIEDSLLDTEIDEEIDENADNEQTVSQGGKKPQKNNVVNKKDNVNYMPIIIAISAAVVLITGGIIGVIFIRKKRSKKN